MAPSLTWSESERIREAAPQAALRSNFIVGYPGETESDHDELLAFLEAAQLDWCGFFAYSEEPGTHAAGLSGLVPRRLVGERLSEASSLQDRITAERRDSLVGSSLRVLVDEPGIARSHREAPEIDGIIEVPVALEAGEFHDVRVVEAAAPISWRSRRDRCASRWACPRTPRRHSGPPRC
ncbi:MAG: hypothetical protein R2716_11535 [Microthrixaceae bacterium]